MQMLKSVHILRLPDNRPSTPSCTTPSAIDDISCMMLRRGAADLVPPLPCRHRIRERSWWCQIRPHARINFKNVLHAVWGGAKDREGPDHCVETDTFCSWLHPFSFGFSIARIYAAWVGIRKQSTIYVRALPSQQGPGKETSVGFYASRKTKRCIHNRIRRRGRGKR